MSELTFRDHLNLALVGSALTAATAAVSFWFIGQHHRDLTIEQINHVRDQARLIDRQVAATNQQISQSILDSTRLEIENARSVAESLNAIRPNFSLGGFHEEDMVSWGQDERAYVISLQVKNDGGLPIDCIISENDVDPDEIARHRIELVKTQFQLGAGSDTAVLFYAVGPGIRENERLRMSVNVTCTTYSPSAALYEAIIAANLSSGVPDGHMTVVDTLDHFMTNSGGRIWSFNPAQVARRLLRR